MMAADPADTKQGYAISPTRERGNHGQNIVPFTATDRAGVYASRVVEACLLDQLRERGHLGKGDAALMRHSAGIWLRGVFHESGLMRSITARLEGSEGGGDPSRPAAYETSTYASECLAEYQRIMRRMEEAVLPPRRAGERDISLKQKRRLAHAVREVACWDRWPNGYTAHEIRKAFDRLASLDGAEAGE